MNTSNTFDINNPDVIFNAAESIVSAWDDADAGDSWDDCYDKAMAYDLETLVKVNNYLNRIADEDSVEEQILCGPLEEAINDLINKG